MIPFGELPNFPVSTVEGHHGNLILGSINGVSVVCLQGRVHLYEGGDPRTIRVPIYTMKLLGCDYLILTSAVGSLKEEAGPAELVCLTDHINFQGSVTAMLTASLAALLCNVLYRMSRKEPTDWPE